MDRTEQPEGRTARVPT